MTQPNSQLVPGYCMRHASEDDMERVGEIARQAWMPVHDSFRRILGAEMHGTICANWEAGKEAQVRSHWEHYPDWFRVVEATETGEAVAFISFRLDAKRMMGTIGNNAVAPEAQGKGIGSMMYRRVLDLFREAGMKYASVGTGMDEGHASARRAYEKAGFDIAKPQVTYYKYL